MHTFIHIVEPWSRCRSPKFYFLNETLKFIELHNTQGQETKTSKRKTNEIALLSLMLPPNPPGAFTSFQILRVNSFIHTYSFFLQRNPYS